MLTGDMQAAMQKLHSASRSRRKPAQKEVPVKEPEKKQPEPQKSGGLLKSLFGKK